MLSNFTVANQTSSSEVKSLDTRMYYQTGLAIILIIGLPVNALIVLAASKFFMCKNSISNNAILKTFHMLIIWNAVNDSAACAYNGFLIAAARKLSILKRTEVCDAYGFFNQLLSLFCVWISFIIAWNRYIVAMATLRENYMPWSVLKTNLLILAALGFNVMVSSLPLTPLEEYYITPIGGCYVKGGSSIGFTEKAVYIFSTAAKSMPIGLVGIIYTLIYLRYRKYWQQIAPKQDDPATTNHVQSVIKQRRLTFMLFITVAVLCGTKFAGGAILGITKPAEVAQSGALLTYSCHAINPFVIILLNPRYRKKVKQMVLAIAFR